MIIDCLVKESYTKEYVQRPLKSVKLNDLSPKIDCKRLPSDTQINLRKRLSRMAYILYLKFKNPVIVDGTSLEIIHKKRYPGATYDFVAKHLSPFDFSIMAENQKVIYRYAICFFDGKKYYSSGTYDVGVIKATHKDSKPKDIIHHFYPLLQERSIKKSLIEDEDRLIDFKLSAIDEMVNKLKKWKKKESLKPLLPKVKYKHHPPRWEEYISQTKHSKQKKQIRSSAKSVLSSARKEVKHFSNDLVSAFPKVKNNEKRYYGKLPSLY